MSDDDGEAPPEDGSESRGNGSEPPDDAPLSDLAERVRDHEDAEDDAMAAFSEVDIEAVDAEELWEQLESDDVDVADDGVAPAGGEEPEADAERDVRVVPKGEYCQRCQFFSDPPETRCTHEDGDILSMVDVEHFRVADCPIARGEEELQNLRR